MSFESGSESKMRVIGGISGSESKMRVIRGISEFGQAISEVIMRRRVEVCHKMSDYDICKDCQYLTLTLVSIDTSGSGSASSSS
jgi:hypothetical protein